MSPATQNEPYKNASAPAVSAFLTEVRKLRRVLQGVDFFARLKIEELETLVDCLKKRTVPRGTVVIEQGDRNADAFYMVGYGKLSVWKMKGKAMEKVDELGPENYFGERALITSEPRAATVRAETDSELYVLYKNDFNSILMKNPSIAQELKFRIGQYKR